MSDREPIEQLQRRNHMWMRLLAVVLGLAIASCAEPTDVGTESTTPLAPPSTLADGERDAARSRWESAEIDSYTFTFRNDCGECGAEWSVPHTIAVVAGEVVSILPTDAAEPSIDRIFEEITAAEANGSMVEVIYHPELGYPLDVSIDMHMRPVDGGTHWVVSDLAAMPLVTSADELRAARARWEALGYTDYSLVMRADCDCPYEGTVKATVRQGWIDDVVTLDRASPDGTLNPITFEETFDEFEEWFIDPDSVEAEGVLEVDIRTDPAQGFPRWVRVTGTGLLEDGLVTIVVTFDQVTPLFATEPEPPVNTTSVVVPGLDEARHLWESHGLVDYRFTLRLADEAADAFEIEVRNGVVASVSADGIPIPADGMQVPTVDEIFDELEMAAQEGFPISASFDALMGYPTEMQVFLPADGAIVLRIVELSPSA